MSFDKMLRDVVRDEVARAVAPLAQAIAQLQAQSSVVTRLASAFGAPVKRGPGRPPKLAAAVSTGGRRGRKAEGASRGCAVDGCGRPARSKGYCAAHYQKYRMLERTNRLPADWKEYAPEGSVQNVALPRGRAGAKALADSKKK